MIRFSVFCLCVSLILATPASKGASKVAPRKLPGARIINGDPASPGQFPYQAALFVNGDDGAWFCGASIINEEWILTAGHCVDHAFNGQVVTGSNDPYGGQITSIAEFVPHEEFDAEQLENDIGLVRLEQPLRLGGNVDAIRLDPQAIHDGQEVTVSGWGVTSDSNEGTISGSLNYVNLITITNEECGESYGGLYEQNICAKSDNNQVKGTCSGDSGGPLVIREGEQVAQVAIVSFVSDSGCESGAPSGYTRVAPYLDWIQGHTGQNLL